VSITLEFHLPNFPYTSLLSTDFSALVDRAASVISSPVSCVQIVSGQPTFTDGVETGAIVGLALTNLGFAIAPIAVASLQVMDTSALQHAYGPVAVASVLLHTPAAPEVVTTIANKDGGEPTLGGNGPTLGDGSGPTLGAGTCPLSSDWTLTFSVSAPMTTVASYSETVATAVKEFVGGAVHLPTPCITIQYVTAVTATGNGLKISVVVIVENAATAIVSLQNADTSSLATLIGPATLLDFTDNGGTTEGSKVLPPTISTTSGAVPTLPALSTILTHISNGQFDPIFIQQVVDGCSSDPVFCRTTLTLFAQRITELSTPDDSDKSDSQYSTNSQTTTALSTSQVAIIAVSCVVFAALVAVIVVKAKGGRGAFRPSSRVSNFSEQRNLMAPSRTPSRVTVRPWDLAVEV